MLTKSQVKNSARIVKLADAFGHLPFNNAGQTIEKTLNLSIPIARLIGTDLITGVRDSFDAVNDEAVRAVEICVWHAIKHCETAFSDVAWIRELANEMQVKAPESFENWF